VKPGVHHIAAAAPLLLLLARLASHSDLSAAFSLSGDA
jgi:hypothetical protein